MVQIVACRLFGLKEFSDTCTYVMRPDEITTVQFCNSLRPGVGYIRQ